MTRKGGPWAAQLRPAPAVKAPGSTIRNKRERETFNLAHLAWRAGAVSDFYFGRRSPEDSTIVWSVGEREYDAGELDAVNAHLTGACFEAGIRSLGFGELWCGYRAMWLETHAGERITERWDGVRVVLERERATVAA